MDAGGSKGCPHGRRPADRDRELAVPLDGPKGANSFGKRYGGVRNELEAKDVEPDKHLEEDSTGDKTVPCSWDRWTYTLETGEHIGDSDIELETFDVVVEHGAVSVELKSATQLGVPYPLERRGEISQWQRRGCSFDRRRRPTTFVLTSVPAESTTRERARALRSSARPLAHRTPPAS